MWGHMSKNIVICCDGTGNQVSGDLTNVLKLHRCVRKDGTHPIEAALQGGKDRAI